MADSVIINNETISTVDTIESVYTSVSTGDGTLIKAFTATNNSAANATYKAYIHDATGVSVGAIIPTQVVIKDGIHHAAGMVNQVVPSGGSIRLETSTADFINFYASGEEL